MILIKFLLLIAFFSNTSFGMEYNFDGYEKMDGEESIEELSNPGETEDLFNLQNFNTDQFLCDENDERPNKRQKIDYFAKKKILDNLNKNNPLLSLPNEILAKIFVDTVNLDLESVSDDQYLELLRNLRTFKGISKKYKTICDSHYSLTNIYDNFLEKLWAQQKKLIKNDHVIITNKITQALKKGFISAFIVCYQLIQVD